MTVSKPTFSAGPEPVMARAALYMSSTDGDAVTPQTSDLMACARHAEKAGLRIVALAGDYDHGDGLGGANLRGLVDRLGHGEFEVIVAQTGGVMITIGATGLGQGEVIQ